MPQVDSFRKNLQRMLYFAIFRKIFLTVSFLTNSFFPNPFGCSILLAKLVYREKMYVSSRCTQQYCKSITQGYSIPARPGQGSPPQPKTAPKSRASVEVGFLFPLLEWRAHTARFLGCFAVCCFRVHPIFPSDFCNRCFSISVYLFIYLLFYLYRVGFFDRSVSDYRATSCAISRRVISKFSA